jgi:hypothetical protein
MSLYLQGVLALTAAKCKLNLIIDSINEETVVVIPSGSLEGKSVSYNGSQVKVFDKLLMFTNFATFRSGEGEIIYDVYQLSCLFLRSLNKGRGSLIDPRQRLFRQFINELLEYCEIPRWYILNYDKINFFNPTRCYKFPEEAISITYEQIIEKIEQMIPNYKLPNILISLKDEKKSTDSAISLEKLVKRKLYEDDEFLNICYGSSSNEDKLPLYHQKHSNCVQNIKKKLEAEYIIIDNLREKISKNKRIMSREEFDEYCFIYVQLFISLLKQKIRNDELDCHLYTSLRAIEDIYNNNLENYINEHYSRLMRIMGEVKEVYDLTTTLLPSDLQELVDRIWYILSNKSYRTK